VRAHALSLKDTAAYITGRVKTAGGEAMRLFTRDAVIAIHKHSKGIPRVISVICDNAWSMALPRIKSLSARASLRRFAEAWR
jgi:general secretion pathway protein A